MVQEIIMYAIVVFAFAYCIRGIAKLFTKKAQGCATGTCGCSSKTDLFHEIKNGKKPFVISQKVTS